MSQLNLIGPAEIQFVEPDRDTWATPWALVRELEARWGVFELDVCCLPETAKAPRFYTPNEDGLAQPWDGRWLCNMPFSKIDPWVEKARYELTEGAKRGGVLILPSRTARPWFHALRRMEADGLCSVLSPKGRLEYVAPPGAKISGNMEDTLIVPCWPALPDLAKIA